MHYQQLNKQIVEVTIKIEAKNIKFNKKAIRWLGIWLNSQLNFTSHMNEKVKKVQTTEIQITGLTRTYITGLCSNTKDPDSSGLVYYTI